MRVIVLSEYEYELLRLIFDGCTFYHNAAIEEAKRLQAHDELDALNVVAEKIKKFRRGIFVKDI